MDLKQCRETIDIIDNQIVALFKQRMETVVAIAAYKREHNLPILNAGREQEVLERISKAAGEELAPYARELFKKLFELSKEYQKRQGCNDDGLSSERV